MVATSFDSVAYTVPVLVGSSQQNLSLQVDTGSSDLWIASTSCSTSPCSDTKGRLYNPKSSNPTGQSFKINYLLGAVSGPIVWDQVQLGTYNISNQALAAATSVTSEPLSYSFDGILGLALPLNSLIAQTITPQTNNDADGAALSSNIFSMTPDTTAPSSPFFSLVLARPGSSALPSLLGIGRHPSSIVPDPSKILYSTLIADDVGILYWKTTLQAITVYVNSESKPVTLPLSISGNGFPTALLDSGVPTIVTTSNIANGIYGALGIGVASDGNYYVPCRTPLNLTITLAGQPELPVHPLDLTAEPSGQSTAQSCIGLIQADDNALSAYTNIGDMILGVPFMRNVYTVMAYEQPNSNGTFDTSIHTGINPSLGLLGLTNATSAMGEFNKVRLLNQPLDPGQPSSTTIPDGGKKLSVGVKVLLGLVGFVGLCILLFLLRWFLTRRKWPRRGTEGGAPGPKDDFAAYQLARRNSQSSVDGPSENTLRTLRYETYMRKKLMSEYTMSSGRTRVGQDPEGYEEDNEFGIKMSHRVNSGLPEVCADEPWEEHMPRQPDLRPDTPTSPDFFPPAHQRTASELAGAPPNISVPLLAHRKDYSRADDFMDGIDMAEFGGRRGSMAGVGTAARGSRIDPDLRHTRVGSDGSTGSGMSVGSRFSRAPVVAPREEPGPPHASSEENDAGRGGP
ncbi:hypothetical protein SERLADRAFT_356395 [Serpula lacrymans var. lacrymans S7.9]|nr:uncharacterized protein SERLADRAFT_356395 [Serpula lacrymans var. lacrymans S7.9]EGO23361.1 hypothetical protein SERLADRAFT_356395 [Serpula lacrymans var. lacrymans S7.9]